SEIDELLLEPDVRDVRDPDLIGADHLQRLDQVREPWEAVDAIGRPGSPRRRLAEQAHLPHQAADPLGVDRVPLPPKHDRQASVAVGRPLARQLAQGLPQRPVLVRPGLVVEAAAVDVQRRAEEPVGVAAPELLDHRPPPIESEASSVEAFCKTSIWSVARPSIRSSSAMRAWSPSRCSSGWNSVWARWRKLAFQSESRL